jgi:hypothetical protein
MAPTRTTRSAFRRWQGVLRGAAVGGSAEAEAVQGGSKFGEQGGIGGGSEVLELIRIGLDVVELAFTARVLDVEVLLGP